MNITTGTTQTFTATVVNSSESGVGWLVNGFPGGVNPNDKTTPFGTIDKNGNYTAPPFVPAPPMVTVTAVANADNSATANASALINGTPSPISISPLSATLVVGQTVNGTQQQGDIALFTATVRDSSPLLWLVENVIGGNENLGTVFTVPGSPDQVYYWAPASIPGGGPTVHITAQSITHPQETATAVITLLPIPTTGAVVEITNPRNPPTVELGHTQSFEAAVTGTSDTGLTWAVDGIVGGNANTGTITAGAKETAVYTAPARVPLPPSSPQVVVTAISNAQPSSQSSMIVNLIPAQKVTVALSTEHCVNPNAIPINSTVQFDALVTGASQDVTWAVNKIVGGNSTVGTITTGGLYTAPAIIPPKLPVTVSATSVEEPTGVGNQPLTIALTTQTSIKISPDNASVPAGLSQEFSSTVLGLADPTTTWYVNGIENGDPDTVGTIQPSDPNGCVEQAQYVAPATIPTPPYVYVTASASDGTLSSQSKVTIVQAPVYQLFISPSQPTEVMVGQSQDYSVLENGDPNDLVTWSVSGPGCSGVACGTIVPPGPQTLQVTAKYTAPLTVPNPNKVTVTVSSVHHPGVNASDQVTIQGMAVPSISITPTFQSVVQGMNQIAFQATIQNYDPGTNVLWQLGCISDWDGGFNQNCNDDDRDGDGPGCMEIPGGRPHCGVSQPLTGPGNVQLTYISPEHLFTTDFQVNDCSGPTNDGNGYVVLTVQLTAQGCPGNTCTANACIQVTP
jgi:hypothetical protein